MQPQHALCYAALLPRSSNDFFHRFLDMCQYLFGEATTVKCEARQSVSQSEFDDFAILLTFESGTIGTFVTSACHDPGGETLHN
jgi:predicted dehydrogenase